MVAETPFHKPAKPLPPLASRYLRRLSTITATVFAGAA